MSSTDSATALSKDFASLGLSDSLLSALKDVGYEQPSPIQEQSIPLLLQGESILGVAQTGTGKTAAFALPLLERLDPKIQSPQIIVLAPTRELAIQVAEAFKSYSRYLPDFTVLPIYGGQDMRGQLRSLKRGVQVIVGTPGRVLDHLQRKSLDLSQIRAVVLDEADEMLRMGFIDDVEEILSNAPGACQYALFSATMPPAIKRVAEKYLKGAKEVRIAAKTSTVERISQHVLMVDNSHKLDALTRVLEVENFEGMIIFVRTKSATTELAEKLQARGYAAEALNGDQTQKIREQTIDRLKKGRLDIVVATDVAARGLDVERIGLVLNYDIPYDTEAYVHRIGRTGRAGREGKAILFAAPKERRLLRAIEMATKQPLTPYEAPSAEKISEQRIQQFQENLHRTLDGQDLESMKKVVLDFCQENELSLEDVAAALAFRLQVEQPLFPILKDLPKLDKDFRGRDRDRDGRGRNPRDRDRRGREGREGRDSRRDDGIPRERYRIEVGRSHDVSPGDIVGAIANEANIESKYIGHIAIYDNFSTVELPEGMPKEVLQHLQKVRIRQQLINMKPDAGKPERKPRSGSGRGGPRPSSKRPRS
ncbi:DEAD/DEAH box helicase [Hahella sp. KA22]|uniref:DEAD/DEAH box helicase n=1 Tax=unclassified Hahella TaxID=2624107 RepID=UPI000FDE62E3|nr:MULTISPECIES: DEAD/DEAH box helicase [unclassified Hahella]AZZ90605.1 DEAD/DEAH box helicase [Hahella sp. KA22]MBU6951925.1 DEAD/DEAH box helicase [Hahella sp. HN01]MDG9670815.1 DEAD/DEAH box helicase [Hahella sp. CR1]QAY53975.1 DEAD/DEAH box helicase [Hahella sp. KA22]